MSKYSGDVLEPLAFGAQIAGVTMGAGAASAKSIADRAAYKMQATAARTNAVVDRAAASDAIRRGQTAAAVQGLKTRAVKSDQVAAMAANGIALDSDTALDILSDTDMTAATEANIIAANASKEAWGYNVRALNDEGNADLLQARANAESPDRALATTLLTGGGAVASRWYGTRHPYNTVD